MYLTLYAIFKFLKKIALTIYLLIVKAFRDFILIPHYSSPRLRCSERETETNKTIQELSHDVTNAP